jgi:hypothetical protein
MSGREVERQRKFLRLLRQTGNYRHAARQTGLGARIPYAWAGDKGFMDKMQRAYVESLSRMPDRFLLERAVERAGRKPRPLAPRWRPWGRVDKRTPLKRWRKSDERLLQLISDGVGGRVAAKRLKITYTTFRKRKSRLLAALRRCPL